MKTKLAIGFMVGLLITGTVQAESATARDSIAAEFIRELQANFPAWVKDGTGSPGRVFASLP